MQFNTEMSQLQLAVISLLLFAAVRGLQGTNEALRVDPAIVAQEEAGNPNSCPPTGIMESARINVSRAVQEALEMLEPDIAPCGGAGWRQIADLDMSRPSEQCPSPWLESSHSPRACRSPLSDEGCSGVFFTSGESYSRICGRAVGHGVGSLDAFQRFIWFPSINNAYLDGLSITRGSQRQHVWSFGATTIGSCPCDSGTSPNPLPFVGEDYFCDNTINGALWDGQDCQNECCTFHSPPFFTVALPALTSDDIEARICTDQHVSDEALYVSVLQIFVQ